MLGCSEKKVVDNTKQTSQLQCENVNASTNKAADSLGVSAAAPASIVKSTAGMQ